ncbi:MAG: methionine--tRNA ligase [Candidatus Kapabacteria bacterium]|nr:methionine--tRNA ligase [Candidatus Kapabacteria bacterium]
MFNRTLITSALPYANGFIHLGHLAGAYLPADMYARFQRLSGRDVLYVCGSDEHGVAITIAAEKKGVTPQEIINMYHFSNKEAFDKFNMTFDIYSRTSEALHHETAREFFADFLEKGFLIEREEEQFYDSKLNMFLPDRYVEGVCPNCSYDHARGDQCDSCGKYYNQLELLSPRSTVSGEVPVVKKTTHWYMRFDMFQEFLSNYIESHSADWKDNVLQQTRSWLNQGMSERAITRDLTWGVKIDGIGNIEPEKVVGKVLYVWFDAVLGYISATKIWAAAQNQAAGKEIQDWKTWWQTKDTEYIAFIGKDNIVFHTLIFPALLHGRGDNYILPENVPANEFLNLEGQKFSKSRNWSIDVIDFMKEFPQADKIDALRYSLAMGLPENKDSDFTWKDFQSRNNNELSAIFGNFINRTLQFIIKNFESKVPLLSENLKSIPTKWKHLLSLLSEDQFIDKSEFPEFNENDWLLIESIHGYLNKIISNYEKFRFRDAVTETMNIARAANKYFNDEQPWKTIKSNPEQAAKTLFVCSQLAYSLSILFAPVVPNACKKIQGFFSQEASVGEVNTNPGAINYFDQALNMILPQGLQINTPEILFAQIEDAIIEAQIAKLGFRETEQPIKETEPLICIDDFKKIKLRTAKIISAENIKKSKKLIKLQVDLGDGDKRQILAGIAEHYTPDQLIGKTIVVVANLEPAKLMGLESQGMLLAANTADGKLSIISFEDEIGVGAEVR